MGDAQGVAGYEHGAEAVNEVSEPGDDQKDADDLGHEPRPVGEVADKQQVDAEKDQAGVPDVGERVDGPLGLVGVGEVGQHAGQLTATRNTPA